MVLRISGKQMDIGDAFRSRIEEKVADAVDKYFGGGYSGTVTVEKTQSRFTATCYLHLDSGIVIEAAGRAQDPQEAFDVAAEHVGKRLRRYKRRLKSHKAGTSDQSRQDVAYRIVEPLSDDEDTDVPADFAPAIVAESTVTLKRLSVAAAVIELDARESPVLAFRNAGNGHINIVYRRNDGNIGWIDAADAATGKAGA